MQFSSLDELLKVAVEAGKAPIEAEPSSAEQEEELTREIDETLAKQAASTESSRTGVAKLALAIDLLSKAT